MVVFSVIGTSGSGKSSYCDRLAVAKGVENESLPIVLKVGEFFRHTLGEFFFYNESDPVTSSSIDQWVRLMVKEALKLAIDLDKDLILDAFPRNPSQLSFLYSIMQQYNVKSFIIRHIYIELECVQIQRLKDRTIANTNVWLDREINFYRKKIKKEAGYISSILTDMKYLQKNTCSPQIICSEVNNG